MKQWIKNQWNKWVPIFQFPDYMKEDRNQYQMGPRWNENNKSCPYCLFPLSYIGVYAAGMKMRERALCPNCGWEQE